jgi:hypothetical protein
VPGFGKPILGSQRDFVLGLGFDGEDTFRLVDRIQPSRVVAILPDPPTYHGFVERCLNANEATLAEWVTASDLIRVGATDALGVAERFRPMAEQLDGCVFVPVGTKPHALGMAVAAMHGEWASILYRWPQSHLESALASAGEIFLYKLTTSGGEGSLERDTFSEGSPRGPGNDVLQAELDSGHVRAASRKPTDVLRRPPMRVFICYARASNVSADRQERWLDRVLEQLRPLHRQNDIALWSDEDVMPGSDWNDAIYHQLSEARLSVLLITPAFLASKYISGVEVPLILRRSRDNPNFTILPVYVEPSTVKIARFRSHESGEEDFDLTTIQGINGPDRTLLEMPGPEQSRTLVLLAETIASTLAVE